MSDTETRINELPERLEFTARDYIGNPINVVITVNHEYLRRLILQASRNKTGRCVGGPLTIRTKRI